MLVRMDSLKNKVDLMKNKNKIGELKIWVGDDLTVREKEVMNWLERKGVEERRRGKEVRVGYMKIWVNGKWWRWEERKGELVEEEEWRKEKFFRGQRR